MINKIKEKSNTMYNWTKAKIKTILITLGIVGVAMAAGTQIIPESPVYQVIDWQKPTTVEGWAEDVKKESLHFKHDYQLDEMEISHSDKIPRVQEDLDKFNACPECIKWGLSEQLKEEFPKKNDLRKAVDEEFESQFASHQWKKDKLNQSVERIKKEKDMRDKKQVDRKPIGTTYYIDADCATPGDGTTATCNNDGTDSYDDLDDFTEVARSAGDKAILRRSRTAQYDDGTDLNFTSDGTLPNPIVIEADYANAWTDDVDLSGTGTATLTFGSKTITFSADISGVLAAGDWIYAASDVAKDFSYEVAAVSTVTVTLYLPYKGAQAGSGKTMTNMGDAPQWNTAAAAFQWDFNGDNYWKIQGLDLRGTDFNGIIEFYQSGYGHVIKDCIFIGNGGSDQGLENTNRDTSLYVEKCRFYNCRAIMTNTATYSANTKFKDCLFDANSTTAQFTSLLYPSIFIMEGCELKGSTTASGYLRIFYGSTLKARNCIIPSVDATSSTGSLFPNIYLEDDGGTIGVNELRFNLASDNATPTIQSETTVVRSGGGSTSIEVTPSTNLSTNWELGKIQLFEYPIYADTTSKTYTVYFKSSGTGNWTADPTNTELWIEAEFWGHASNNYRKITKSTGVCDFNGDDTTWHTLTVTVQPSQTGILYLRGWYAKTKEAGSNIFYIDVAPVIS